MVKYIIAKSWNSSIKEIVTLLELSKILKNRPKKVKLENLELFLKNNSRLKRLLIFCVNILVIA